uniref:SSD domain-containing protein n=1 Tax=Timema monikensis TaxID=170555 RepID=A0A7R9HLP6_9NEOP|nr:unnamed protein product [Timema monikensis]
MRSSRVASEVKGGFVSQLNLCRDRGLNHGPPAQKSDTLLLDHQVTDDTVENHPQCTRPGLNPNIPVFGSLVQHEISTLDHPVTEAVHNNVYITRVVHISCHLSPRTTHCADPCYANAGFTDPLPGTSTHTLDTLVPTLNMLAHSLNTLSTPGHANPDALCGLRRTSVQTYLLPASTYSQGNENSADIMDLETQVKAINVSEHGWEDVCAGYLTWFKDDAILEFQEEIDAAIKEGIFRNDCIYQSLMKLWDANSSTIHSFKALTQDKILDNLTQAVNFSTQKNVLDEVKPLLSQLEYDLEGRVKGAKATILNWMLKKTVLASLDWELEFIQQTLFSNRTLPKGMKVYAVSSRRFNEEESSQKDVEISLNALDDNEPFYGFEMNDDPMLDIGERQAHQGATGTESDMLVKRGPSRPKLMRIGRRGHPTKIYQPAANRVDQKLALNNDPPYELKAKHRDLCGLTPETFRAELPLVVWMRLIVAGLSLNRRGTLNRSSLATKTRINVPVWTYPKIIEVYLSLMAVSLVGQAILASYGLCFYMGFFWGPIHPILPFLLLGVGIDNTFVIVQCVDNIKQDDKRVNIPDRIALALEKAEYIAPALMKTPVKFHSMVVGGPRSWESSFGCEVRIGKRQCCIQARVVQGSALILVILSTITLFAVNIACVLQVEQRFDPIWYLNPESYPIQFNDKLNQYFPQFGKRAGIYLGGVNYFEEEERLNKLFSLLKSNHYINNATVDFWYPAFKVWLSKRITEQYEFPEDEDSMKGYLSEYLLFTKEGQTFVKDIKFTQLPIGEYNITTSKITIQHILMNTTDEQVDAMESIQNILKDVNFTNDEQIVAFSPDYVSWTANKIIGEELIRNLGLTIGAVSIVTLVLIQNIRTALLVISCVIFTVTDLVACELGILAVPGTIVSIFPLRRGSEESYPMFITSMHNSSLAYCKTSELDHAATKAERDQLFSGVVTFGVFHGLIFLPVILSWLGPEEQKIPHCKVSLPLKQDDVLFSPLNMNKEDIDGMAPFESQRPEQMPASLAPWGGLVVNYSFRIILLCDVSGVFSGYDSPVPHIQNDMD